MTECERLWLAVDLEACLVVAGIGPEITSQDIARAKMYCREVLDIEPDKRFVAMVRKAVFEQSKHRRSHGHRRISGRDEKGRAGGRYKRVITCTKPRAKGGTVQAGKSKNMENRSTGERRQGKINLAPARGYSTRFQRVSFTSDPPGTYEHDAKFIGITDAVNEGMR